jgi:hypothetical protein
MKRNFIEILPENELMAINSLSPCDPLDKTKNINSNDKIEEEIKDNELIIDNFDITTTEAVILELIAQLKVVPLKGVFLSQVYAVESNKTLIDTEISLLRESKNGHNPFIKLIHCPKLEYSHDNQTYVMLYEDYERDIINTINSCTNAKKLISLRKYLNVQCNALSIFQKDLMQCNCYPRSNTNSISSNSGDSSVNNNSIRMNHMNEEYLTNDDVNHVISFGYLSHRRDSNAQDLLWFSHPKIGHIIQLMGLGRKYILNAMNSKKYREISVVELIKLQSKNEGKKTNKWYFASPYSIKFHVYDLIGSKLVTTVDKPSGGLILRPP